MNSVSRDTTLSLALISTRKLDLLQTRGCKLVRPGCNLPVCLVFPSQWPREEEQEAVVRSALPWDLPAGPGGDPGVGRGAEASAAETGRGAGGHGPGLGPI